MNSLQINGPPLSPGHDMRLSGVKHRNSDHRSFISSSTSLLQNPNPVQYLYPKLDKLIKKKTNFVSQVNLPKVYSVES